MSTSITRPNFIEVPPENPVYASKFDLERDGKRALPNKGRAGWVKLGSLGIIECFAFANRWWLKCDDRPDVPDDPRSVTRRSVQLYATEALQRESSGNFYCQPFTD